MKQIYKYTIPVLSGESLIQVPTYTTPLVDILSVANQREELVFWTQVDTERPLQPYKFLCVLTGDIVPENTEKEKYVYIGTVTFDNGNFVVHVFLICEKFDV
jgi:hypothetical protein